MTFLRNGSFTIEHSIINRESLPTKCSSGFLCETSKPFYISIFPLKLSHFLFLISYFSFKPRSSLLHFIFYILHFTFQSPCSKLPHFLFLIFFLISYFSFKPRSSLLH